MIAVFDTNIYRSLSFEKSPEEIKTIAEKLAECELSSGFNAHANPFVILELLFHLGNREDSSFENCRSSIILATLHCGKCLNGRKEFYILADSEEQLCNLLFNVELERNSIT